MSAISPPSCSERVISALALKNGRRRLGSRRAIASRWGRSRPRWRVCSVIRVSRRCGSTERPTRSGRAWPVTAADALLTGIHEPDTSHYQLLRAFADEDALRRASVELDAHGYRSHEFGDSALIERKAWRAACAYRVHGPHQAEAFAGSLTS